jgi:hypothetical protein
MKHMHPSLRLLCAHRHHGALRHVERESAVRLGLSAIPHRPEGQSSEPVDLNRHRLVRGRGLGADGARGAAYWRALRVVL